eukprot:g3803.t1
MLEIWMATGEIMFWSAALGNAAMGGANVEINQTTLQAMSNDHPIGNIVCAILEWIGIFMFLLGAIFCFYEGAMVLVEERCRKKNMKDTKKVLVVPKNEGEEKDCAADAVSTQKSEKVPIAATHKDEEVVLVEDRCRKKNMKDTKKVLVVPKNEADEKDCSTDAVSTQESEKVQIAATHKDEEVCSVEEDNSQTTQATGIVPTNEKECVILVGSSKTKMARGIPPEATGEEVAEALRRTVVLLKRAVSENNVREGKTRCEIAKRLVAHLRLCLEGERGRGEGGGGGAAAGGAGAGNDQVVGQKQEERGTMVGGGRKDSWRILCSDAQETIARAESQIANALLQNPVSARPRKAAQANSATHALNSLGQTLSTLNTVVKGVSAANLLLEEDSERVNSTNLTYTEYGSEAAGAKRILADMRAKDRRADRWLKASVLFFAMITMLILLRRSPVQIPLFRILVETSKLLGGLEKWHARYADEQVAVALKDTSAFWKAISARKSLVNNENSSAGKGSSKSSHGRSRGKRQTNSSTASEKSAGGSIPLSFVSLNAWLEFLKQTGLLHRRISPARARHIFLQSKMWNSPILECPRGGLMITDFLEAFVRLTVALGSVHQDEPGVDDLDSLLGHDNLVVLAMKLGELLADVDKKM